jgi:hypothetical protein
MRAPLSDNYKGFKMHTLKKTGFYVLSPFTMIFALLFILLTPDQLEFDGKAKTPKAPTHRPVPTRPRA